MMTVLKQLVMKLVWNHTSKMIIILITYYIVLVVLKLKVELPTLPIFKYSTRIQRVEYLTYG